MCSIAACILLCSHSTSLPVLTLEMRCEMLVTKLLGLMLHLRVCVHTRRRMWAAQHGSMICQP